MAHTVSWQTLRHDERGTALIETAFVLPILCLLSLGAFEASWMVARNTELQGALAETAAIALARPPQDQPQVDTLEDILEASTGLADDAVTMERRYRCGTEPTLVDDADDCSSSFIVSSYLVITVADSYSPRWVSFGIGSPVTFSLTQTVQIG
jgi:Flp pilus assembly protein TadG